MDRQIFESSDFISTGGLFNGDGWTFKARIQKENLLSLTNKDGERIGIFCSRDVMTAMLLAVKNKYEKAKSAGVSEDDFFKGTDETSQFKRILLTREKRFREQRFRNLLNIDCTLKLKEEMFAPNCTAKIPFSNFRKGKISTPLLIKLLNSRGFIGIQVGKRYEAYLCSPEIFTLTGGTIPIEQNPQQEAAETQKKQKRTILGTKDRWRMLNQRTIDGKTYEELAISFGVCAKTAAKICSG